MIVFWIEFLFEEDEDDDCYSCVELDLEKAKPTAKYALKDVYEATAKQIIEDKKALENLINKTSEPPRKRKSGTEKKQKKKVKIDVDKNEEIILESEEEPLLNEEDNLEPEEEQSNVMPADEEVVIMEKKSTPRKKVKGKRNVDKFEMEEELAEVEFQPMNEFSESIEDQ